MPTSVLETSHVVEETNGVAAGRVVVRGSATHSCKYPAAANAAAALGVTLDAAPLNRTVPVRRIGRARAEAAAAIAAGAPVCVADASGRIKAAGYATLATGVVGSNNAIRWTSRIPGPIGNSITVSIINAGANATLAITVIGNAIEVSLATNGSSVATSTAAQVIAAVQAHAVAGVLVAAANESTSTGAAVPGVFDTTALSGGEAGAHIVGIAEESAAAAGDLIDILLRG